MKRGCALLAVVCVAFTGSVCSETYPATWPNENEAYQLPSMPDVTPDYTFTDQDTGNYYHSHGALCDWNEYDGVTSYNRGGFETDPADPFAYIDFCGGNQYLLKFFYGAPASLPWSNWNCTAKGVFFAASDFYGTLGSLKVDCAGGNCCNEYVGLAKFSDEAAANHEGEGTHASVGMCTEIYEEVYCQLVSTTYNIVCMESVPTWTATEKSNARTIVPPCPDNFSLYYISCPVFKSTGIANKISGVFEPVPFTATLTVDQTFYVWAIFQHYDHVCHPYSYFHPATAEPTAETPSTSTSDDSETSGAALPLALAAAGLLLLH